MRKRFYEERSRRLCILPAGIGLAGMMLAALGAGAYAETLSLDASVKLAVDNNPQIRIMAESRRRSEAVIDEATAQGMPKLTLDGQYQRLDQVPEASFGGNSIKLGSLDNRTVDLTLVQPIDIYGIIKKGKVAAKHNLKAADYEFLEAVESVTLQTKLAYFDVLRAKQYQRVQDETIKLLEAHLKDAEANLTAGTIARFDVLRAETQVANARQQLIAAENGVEMAKAAFNNVLGRPLVTLVDLEDVVRPEFVDLQLVKCVDSARTNRPEVLKVGMQVASAGDYLKIADDLGKPRFNLRWNYNRNLDTTMFNPRDASWRAFLTASLSIFDGGASKAQVKMADADYQSVKSVYEQTLQNVSLDTQQAFLSLKEGRERIQAAEKALEQAREAMRLAQVRYKGGVSTQVEVLDAQTALTLAETNHVNALYDYQAAQARLEKSVGGRKHWVKLLEESAQTVASGQPVTEEKH